LAEAFRSTANAVALVKVPGPGLDHHCSANLGKHQDILNKVINQKVECALNKDVCKKRY
jgi:hypothetical protein